MRRPVAPAVLAGLLVGSLVTAALAAAGLPVPAERRASGLPGSLVPAARLVEAWERSQTATFHLVGQAERTRSGETAPERSPLEIVQRPPDRLVEQFGSLSGRLDGRLVACAPGPDRFRCTDGGAAPGYAEAVEDDVRNLAEQVLGLVPLYRVSAEDGCFGLRRLVVHPNPPFGDRARLCFDESTGALTVAEIVRPDRVDRLVAITVAGTVTDELLALPSPLEQ